MVKERKGSSTATSLKSPSSAQLTSKPDKDEDVQPSRKASSTDKSTLKSPKGSFRQFLSKKDLINLKKAKAAGGAGFIALMAQARNKLAPKQHKSMSARANTAMPVKKVKTRIQQSVPKDSRVTTEAGVALSAVLDYAVSELIDNACQACELKKKRTITPQHIKLGVPQDESLAVLFRGVTIPQGGTVPTFHPELQMDYKKRKQPRYETYSNPKESKNDSSPSSYSGGKKGESDSKPRSSGQDSGDPKKDKPGASSSSPAEK